MPTKTYLKKFVTRCEGNPPVIDNKTFFRQFVFALLEKRVIRDQEYRPKNLSEQGHNDQLTLLVTNRTFTHIGHSISMEKAMYINNFIKADFAQRLTISVVNLHVRKGLEIRKSLETFCEFHGIEVEVDISMDNLIKIWHRTLSRMEPVKNNVTGNLIIPYSTGYQLDLF
jgi:hypothetical protein